jgi:hypothetical protein
VLTAEQIAHWEAFGFLVLRQLFKPDEVKALREAATEVVNQQGGGNAFTSAPRFGMGSFLERHPALANWVDDDRIHGMSEALLGPDYILQRTGGAVYWGDTPWHGGHPAHESPPFVPYKTAKIGMYFDSLNGGNGCLRVIPGSHRRPFSDHLRPLYREHGDPVPESFGLAEEDIRCVALDSEPGDVIVFTERVFHAAFETDKGRLQITAEYLANPTTDEQIASIRTYHDQFTWSFHPSESYISSDRPRIRRMVSRLVELGCTPLQV